MRPVVATLLLFAAIASAANTPPDTTLRRLQRPIGEIHALATIEVGKTADWVALTHDAVWVGSTGPYAVHRIDPRTNSAVAHIELPGEPCAGLVTGFGSLWVPLCATKPQLAKVDLSSNAIATVLDFGTSAECGIAASRDSIWLVLADSGTLARIEPATGQIRQRIELPPGSCNPHYSDGVVWITNAKGAQVTAVDATSGAILTSIPTGPNPRFLNHGAGAIWTLNQGDGTLTRIDSHSRSKTASIALGTPGPGGDIAFGGDLIWTTMAGTPLTAVDPATNSIRRQWVGPGGDSLAVGHGAIWLTDYHKGTITRIALHGIFGP